MADDKKVQLELTEAEALFAHLAVIVMAAKVGGKTDVATGAAMELLEAIRDHSVSKKDADSLIEKMNLMALRFSPELPMQRQELPS